VRYREKLSLALNRIADGTLSMLSEWDAEGGGVPAFNYMTGRYDLQQDYTPQEWSSSQWVGYLVGKLWLLGEFTGEVQFSTAAEKLTRMMLPTLTTTPATFAAVGKDVYFGLCRAYDKTGNPEYKEAALQGLSCLHNLFDSRLGLFRQSIHKSSCVIDTANTMTGFYWAAKFDPRHGEHITNHNRRILDLGVVRPDGSTFQAVTVEDGLTRLHTVQGYADSSTWSRGQAWGIHNFTIAYEATGAPEFLSASTQLVDWYLEHLPVDWIPFYDFDDPNAAIPRDSCSATLVANSLCKLVRVNDALEKRYRPALESMLGELVANYLSPGGVFLHGSWGQLGRGRLPRGRFPQEDIMPYANYWGVEALYRELSPEARLLSL